MIFAGGLIILGTLYNICIDKHIPYPTQIQEAPHYDFIQQKNPKKTPLHTYLYESEMYFTSQEIVLCHFL